MFESVGFLALQSCGVAPRAHWISCASSTGNEEPGTNIEFFWGLSAVKMDGAFEVHHLPTATFFKMEAGSGEPTSRRRAVTNRSTCLNS